MNLGTVAPEYLGFSAFPHSGGALCRFIPILLKILCKFLESVATSRFFGWRPLPIHPIFSSSRCSTILLEILWKFLESVATPRFIKGRSGGANCRFIRDSPPPSPLRCSTDSSGDSLEVSGVSCNLKIHQRPFRWRPLPIHPRFSSPRCSTGFWSLLQPQDSSEYRHIPAAPSADSSEMLPSPLPDALQILCEVSGASC